MSTNKLFVDTNIWLYSIIDGQDYKKHKIAKKILSQTKNISVSTQVINEICANIRKKTDLPEVEIRKIIADFYQNYEVIAFNSEILLKASQLRENLNVSYWDSLVLSCAHFADCTFLISEDMQHNQLIDNQFRIFNPFVAEFE
jgi:predicted nucleic acid-binding protein